MLQNQLIFWFELRAQNLCIILSNFKLEPWLKHHQQYQTVDYTVLCRPFQHTMSVYCECAGLTLDRQRRSSLHSVIDQSLSSLTGFKQLTSLI